MANNINKFLDKAGLTRLISWIKGALNSKQDTLAFDTTPTTNSNNPVTSGGVKAAIDALGTPNEIVSITTQESSASGGNNVVTITDTDGTVTTFNVKNGKDGQNGADGADGVSLGEIALVQTTGDSEESVMSQKAVTDYGRKITDEDSDGTSEWIKSKLIEEGWEFGKYINTSGRIASNASYCATPFIPVNNIKGHNMTYTYMFSTGPAALAFYTSEKTFISGQAYQASSNNSRGLTISSSDTLDTAAYVRLTLNPQKIKECSLVDGTTGEFIFNGAEVVATLCDELNLTYGYLKKEDLSVSSYIYKTPTYLQGRLCFYNLAQYPQLDPRTSDGISITFAVDNNSNISFNPLFALWKFVNANSGLNLTTFSMWWRVSGFLSFGKLNNYGDSLVTGGSRVLHKAGHWVITYDFKTGITKYYHNGELLSTISPTSYDEQTVIRDYFDTCTHLQLSAFQSSNGNKINGIAMFGRVLEDSDVEDLYGSGRESIKTSLIPAKWKAYNLKPIYPENWGVYMQAGTSASSTEGGFILSPTSSGSLHFGFNGIEGVINNVIYDWDFEIISGTTTHTSDNFSRKMRYNSQAYAVFKIYNESGDDVTLNTLGVGKYHVTCKPDNILAGQINASSLVLIYYFYGCSSDFSMKLSPALKITERGAALECSIETYAGLYWNLANGIKLPISEKALSNTTKINVGTDTYISDTVKYTSSIIPQFNGQIAVDTDGGKVYIGYLTSAGGTWKQVSN